MAPVILRYVHIFGLVLTIIVIGVVSARRHAGDGAPPICQYKCPAGFDDQQFIENSDHAVCVYNPEARRATTYYDLSCFSLAQCRSSLLMKFCHVGKCTSTSKCHPKRRRGHVHHRRYRI